MYRKVNCLLLLIKFTHTSNNEPIFSGGVTNNWKVVLLQQSVGLGLDFGLVAANLVTNNDVVGSLKHDAHVAKTLLNPNGIVQDGSPTFDRYVEVYQVK